METCDLFFMREAISLALKGGAKVAPNPMVGCVIVYANKVVARGYHHVYGSAHAEVNAVNELDKTYPPKDCTVYVTLEPCSHFGKTPPCANLLVERGFAKVVIGCLDPNPLVAGKGMALLKTAGIAVKHGVLESECRQLNKRFFTYHEKKRPYIFLKWAQTADGFISRWPLPNSKSENWISSQMAQQHVHAMRAMEAAILVGKNTVLADNPQLNVRLVEGKNPVRLVIDARLEIPETLAIYNSTAPTVIYNALKEEERGAITFKKLDFNKMLLPQLVNDLWQRQLNSVIIEGGTHVLNQFIEQNLWDEAIVFVNSDLNFGSGIKAPRFLPLSNKFTNGQEKQHFFNTY